ncbi:MAG TPA: CDP-alcohol phosphatidyltransferase family protein [Blastocatellia bacterium]|nr:CDP-alcohol phosphatidyltransferase family protein [Blastocatellia bacterium]
MPESLRVWTAPNLLTIGRIILILPFLYLINRASYGLALLVFFIASITDFIDGYIARNYNQQSPLGRLLDPAADKLLTTAAFIVMAIPQTGIPSIPVWLAVAVVLRDVIILLGSLVVYLIAGFKDFKPTQMGRINTFLEMGLIVFFLLFHTIGAFTSILPLCYLIVVSSVIISGGEYLIQGINLLRKTV